MTSRWWAPEIASDAPEEAALAMLSPGQDPEKDLGLYLLAAHRVGASSLQHVAKSQVPSELTLINGLASARTAVAPVMVDAIAPIRGATYAGLFVRDVLDAADQGALDLYRASVAKGVAPPIAMERAASAYVMPMREMGVFASMATDVKANPRAVEDAADRALMTYVAKTASLEVSDDVAKAATTTATDPKGNRVAVAVAETDWDEREHPRGGDGRFTNAPTQTSTLDRIRQRLGLTSTEPQKVGDTVKEDKQKQLQARKTRAARASRVRQVASIQPVAPSRKTKATAPTRNLKRTPAQRRQKQLSFQRITQRLNPVLAEPAKSTLTVIPDLLKKFEVDDPGFYEIGQPIIIGAGMVGGASIRIQASTQAVSQSDPSRRVFRIGYLQDAGRYVEQGGVAQAVSHDSSAQVEVASQASEYMFPEVKIIGEHQLEGDDREDAIFVENQRKQMAMRTIEMPSGDMRDVLDHGELGHIMALPIYEPFGKESYDDFGHAHGEYGAIAIVHFQAADSDNPMRRPIPTLDEYVVPEGARGMLEGAGKHVDVHLDPNQVYEVVNGPGKSLSERVQPERFFDTENGVVVNRWFLRPLDHEDVKDLIPGVEKALAPAELRTFNDLHPRDSEGQFVQTQEQTAAPSVKTKPSQLEIRRTRAQRFARVKAAQRTKATPQPVTARASASRSTKRYMTRTPERRQQRSTMTRALDARALERRVPNMPVLSDARAYKVLSERDFQRLMRGVSLEQFQDIHAGGTHQLDSLERRALSETSDVRVDAIPSHMAVNVSQQSAEQEIPRELLDTIPFLPRGGAPDFEHIAERIHHVFDVNPDYDLIELMPDDLEESIYILGSKVSGSFQNIIEFEHDIDFTAPLSISYLGESRARDVLAQAGEQTSSLIGDLSDLDHNHDGLMANPLVHRYRVFSPPVRRYRVDN